MSLPRASPGKPVSASAWNRLVDAVIEALKARKVFAASDVSVEFDVPVPARISAVHGVTGSGPDGPIGSITYDFVMRDTQKEFFAQKPFYGRPILDSGEWADVRIIPCAVNDRCWVVRSMNDDGTLGPARLMVATEKLSLARCGTGGELARTLTQKRDERMQRIGRTQDMGGSSISGAPGVPGGGIGA